MNNNSHTTAIPDDLVSQDNPRPDKFHIPQGPIMIKPQLKNKRFGRVDNISITDIDYKVVEKDQFQAISTNAVKSHKWPHIPTQRLYNEHKAKSRIKNILSLSRSKFNNNEAQDKSDDCLNPYTAGSLNAPSLHEAQTPKDIELITSIMHKPVLLNEVITLLDPREGTLMVDATFGAGGHSLGLLRCGSSVIAMDQDESVAKIAKALTKSHTEARLTFICDNFCNLPKHLKAREISSVDGILLDLGVSSMQLDQGHRGFSFMHDGPLSMRMSCANMDLLQPARDEILIKTSVKSYLGNTQNNPQVKQSFCNSVEANIPLDAYAIANHMETHEIADIISEFGEESRNKSLQIARAICMYRKEKPICTTHELAQIIRSCFSGRHSKIDNATKTFQAFRIYVNSELDVLKASIIPMAHKLKQGGNLVIISFHSLEDRIIKQYFNLLCGYHNNLSDELINSHIPNPDYKFELLRKGVISPSTQEIKSNPRSRSAKLRGIRRI